MRQNNEQKENFKRICLKKKQNYVKGTITVEHPVYLSVPTMFF